MGCDIHLVLEQRDGEKWIAINTFESHHSLHEKPNDPLQGWSMPVTRSRNYGRFAALAGVRGDGPKPLGLPLDVSETGALLAKGWGVDGHSHSWLPLAEASRLWLETEYDPPEQAAKSPIYYFFNLDCSEGSGKLVSNYRVVFWFDN